MNRKIIQIAVLTEGDLTAPGLFALCEDGSLHLFTVGCKTWSEVPAIPEPKSSQETRSIWYKEGYQKGINGLSTGCPYTSVGLEREEWQDGYIRGMRKFKAQI